MKNAFETFLVKIRNLLAADQDLQLARTLRAATWVGFLFTLLVLISLLVSGGQHLQAMVSAVVALGFEVFVFFLVQRRRLTLAAMVLIVMAWALFSVDIYSYSGILSTSVLGQVVIVILSAVAVSGSFAIFLALFSVLINFSVYLRQANGDFLPPDAWGVTWERWLLISIYALIAAVFMWLAMRRLKETIAENQSIARNLKALFDQTTDTVFMVDLDFKVEKANANSSRLLGFAPQELIGRSALDFVIPEHHANIQKFLPWLLAGRRLPVFEVDLLDNYGNVLTVEADVALVRDDAGRDQHIQIIIRDITQRKKYMRELQFSAHHDPLTQLSNRVVFEARLQQALQYAERNNSHLAVFFLDLDGFKEINDSYGHVAGDNTLREVARRLKAAAHDNMTLARIGGDEFTVLVENIENEAQVTALAQEFLNAFRSPLSIADDQVYIGATIGVSIFPHHGDSFTELVHQADLAMYKAKADGKMRIEVSRSQNAGSN
jgi:diguanylate cyclase (GGDEF)-like protein/PAS domain S-box-containing protein